MLVAFNMDKLADTESTELCLEDTARCQRRMLEETWLLRCCFIIVQDLCMPCVNPVQDCAYGKAPCGWGHLKHAVELQLLIAGIH